MTDIIERNYESFNPIKKLNFTKLNKIDYEQNKLNFINNLKLDSLIRQTFARPLFDARNLPTITHPQILSNFEPNKNTRNRFACRDFLAQVFDCGLIESELRVGGKEVDFADGKYTRVDFTPDGRTHFDATKMTDSLVDGLVGIREFVAAFDKHTIDFPDVLVGSTNIQMALIAQRLGFVIVDQCRTAKGEIDYTRKQFTIVGRIDDIRKGIDKYQKEGRLEKLQKRLDRLQNPQIPSFQPNLSPALS